jgi:hypothetical protein
MLMQLRMMSGINLSLAKSPPPITLPALTATTFGPPETSDICCHALTTASVATLLAL